MRILKRLVNAYKTNGFAEILRKSFFFVVYSFFNFFTKFKVMYSNSELGLNCKSKRNKKIIVSLTSYPKRFKYIGLCLKSLLLQKFKPDKIIVYLGSDSKIEDLTDEMLFYENYGIEYRFDKYRNLKPHKKYYYAMLEYPEDIVVTADDDIIYPSDWLDSLVKSYKKYPNSISARRVHFMRFDNQGNLLPYNKWFDQCRSVRKPSKFLVATGGSGALYPPKSLSSLAFDAMKIEVNCLDADDIWLKAMEMLNYTSVVWVPNIQVAPITIDGDINYALSKTNVEQNKNDYYINKVFDEYQIWQYF